MIHADLKGKTDAEDVLTSNCLGLLHLLPDNDFISFLGNAVALDGTPINLSPYERVERIDFWPWLPQGVEPDSIVKLQNKDGSVQIWVVIEVKHGAGKSNRAFPSEVGPSPSDGTDNLGIVEREQQSTIDQLAKYWRAASKCFPSTALIYLTHHRSLPKDDIIGSLNEAGSDARIFWLSWFHLYRWVTNKLTQSHAYPISEKRILETLHKYIEDKGYACFLGWPQLSEISNCQFNYSHTFRFTVIHGMDSDYRHSYGMDRTAIFMPSQTGNYTHTYQISQITMSAKSLCFYKILQEES